MGRKTLKTKETGWKETRGKATGAKTPGAKREMDNTLPGDMTAGQNSTEGIRRKSYSEVVIEGVRRRARVFMGDLITENYKTL